MPARSSRRIGAHSLPGVTLYGLWFMVYGLWFMVYGLWFMVYGLWFMVYGLWFMVYGLWFMVYGLWFMVVYGLVTDCTWTILGVLMS
jgi:hypothetical protein